MEMYALYKLLRQSGAKGYAKRFSKITKHMSFLIRKHFTMINGSAMKSEIADFKDYCGTQITLEHTFLYETF
jgi:hypothetical protein